MRFAFLGRVSTEDAQDPEASRGWQLRRARSLIEPQGGVIVAEFFDIGQSRSLPWSRRPEASRLLTALKDHDRGFEAVVIGEPQRAFYGNQFSLTFPVFVHYGVSLWVPEVGGAVDPGSEAHDMLMNLFGGMSKGERARVQIRVRAAMHDLAERSDRFLGGRPPYGYRLADVGPHPNPSKAAAGQRLHRLDPDPVTAPVVERIFTMFGVDELGLRAIAEALTNEGIPSPSAYDPARNRHRNPSGWSHSAVRAILVNPTYRGTRVWGKQERFESLVDPDDVAAGNQTRMRWRQQDTWIRPDAQTHTALVSAELAALVAGRFGSRSPGTPRARSSNRPYALRGIIYCSRCGSRLQGSYRPSRSDRPGRVLYRCEIRRTRALPAELADHPSTLYVNEAAILEPLDAWIESFSDPAWLAESQTSDPASAARLSGMRSQLADLDRRIANLVDAVETGADPGPILRQLSQRTAERDALAVRMATAARPSTLSGTQIEAITAELGGIAEALQRATTEERAAIYASLDIRLDYDDRSHQVRATSNLARVANRVGGGT
ncbi:MAG: recombinase family protein [Actinomycetota bacterium]|nr:recombinase family protein [Actinomycetota bacterium]